MPSFGEYYCFSRQITPEFKEKISHNEISVEQCLVFHSHKFMSLHLEDNSGQDESEFDWNAISDLRFFIPSRADFYELYPSLIRHGVHYANIVKPAPPEKEVQIGNQIYIMKEEFLILPAPPLSKERSLENLVKFNKILAENNIVIFLLYGTLLGAIREGDFISHDTDTDIGIYSVDRPKLMELLFALREAGFEMVRYTPGLLSFMRNGDYIDVGCYERKKFPKNGWISDGLFIAAEHLDALEEISFLGNTFKAPKNPRKLLATQYGSTWMTPIRGVFAPRQKSIIERISPFIPTDIKNYIKRITGWKR